MLLRIEIERISLTLVICASMSNHLSCPININLFQSDGKNENETLEWFHKFSDGIDPKLGCTH